MIAEEFKGKNLVELLDMLEPVSDPPAVSMWPQTQGWVWLSIAAVGLVIWISARWVAAHKARAYRRAALAEIAAANGDATAIAGILRRTALVAYPRQKVAHLAGENWLNFLDLTYEGKEFSSDTGRAMLSAPYCANPPQIQGLDVLASRWVKSHSKQVHL